MKDIEYLMNKMNKQDDTKFIKKKFWRRNKMDWGLFKCQNRKEISILAKRIVSKYYGDCFEEVSWKTTEYGKPYFITKDKEISCFNYAHSGNYLLIGLAYNKFLGVDVEDLSKKRKNIDNILTIFSNQEYEYVRTLSIEKRIETILNIWVKKEAIGKALGVGLLYDTSQITVCERFANNSLVANTVIVNDSTITYFSRKIEQCYMAVAYIKEGN